MDMNSKNAAFSAENLQKLVFVSLRAFNKWKRYKEGLEQFLSESIPPRRFRLLSDALGAYEVDDRLSEQLSYKGIILNDGRVPYASAVDFAGFDFTDVDAKELLTIEQLKMRFERQGKELFAFKRSKAEANILNSLSGNRLDVWQQLNLHDLLFHNQNPELSLVIHANHVS